MAKIPMTLQPHIDTAFPANVCLLGSVLPNGYAQVTPRGGTMVFDDEHIALWERGKGSTSASMTDGTLLTVYFRKPQLREEGVLPKGGIARCRSTSSVLRVSGSVASAAREWTERGSTSASRSAPARTAPIEIQWWHAMTAVNAERIAKIAVTVDHLSKGRLEFGIGAAWNEPEHRELGIPFPPTAERLVCRLADVAEVIRAARRAGRAVSGVSPA